MDVKNNYMTHFDLENLFNRTCKTYYDYVPPAIKKVISPVVFCITFCYNCNNFLYFLKNNNIKLISNYDNNINLKITMLRFSVQNQEMTDFYAKLHFHKCFKSECISFVRIFAGWDVA